MVPTYNSFWQWCALLAHIVRLQYCTHCMFAVVCTSATNCTYKVHNRHKLAVMGTADLVHNIQYYIFAVVGTVNSKLCPHSLQ